MKVSIQLTAWFKKYSKGNNVIIVEIEDKIGSEVGEGNNSKIGITAMDVIIVAGIPQDEIGVITKDGYKISEDSLLRDGDKIKIFTTILGG